MVGAKFCYLELLVFMVLLPGVSCSPMPRCHPANLIEYRMTIESMTRRHKAKRFLLMTENLSGEFNLSFTGGDRAPGTEFVLRKGCPGQNLGYSFKPFKKPEFIIAVENGQLMVKNASTVDLTDQKWRFDLKTISVRYSGWDRKSNVKMIYYALASLSTPRAVIKSKRSGKVYLDNKNNLKSCRAWLKTNLIW